MWYLQRIQHFSYLCFGLSSEKGVLWNNPKMAPVAQDILVAPPAKVDKDEKVKQKTNKQIFL